MLTQGGSSSELFDQVCIEVFDLSVNFLRSFDRNLGFRVVKSNFLSPIFFEITVDFLNLFVEFLIHLLIPLKFFLLWHLWGFWILNVRVVLLHREQAQNI